MCSPSASHSPCVRQRSPGRQVAPLARAPRHARAFLDRRHDLGDADVRRMPRQAVAARAPALAVDEPGAAQSQEELLEIGERNVLAIGDRRKWHRAVGAMLGEICHGHDRITTSGIQIQRLAPDAAAAKDCGTPAILLALATPGRAIKPAKRWEAGSVSNHSKFQPVYGNSERASQVFSPRQSTQLVLL